MEGHRWEVVLPDGSKTPIDRNDFSFMENGEKKQFDFAYITIHGTPGENGTVLFSLWRRLGAYPGRNAGTRAYPAPV